MGHDLAPVARTFGQLLLHELDPAWLQEMAEPAIAAALGELGVGLPSASDLDALAAQFFALVLHPRGEPPLVQSLWQQGRYDGEAAAEVRRIAAGAGLRLGDGARGAPPDHLGCLLLLWADLVVTDPGLAAVLARNHLAWVAATSAPRAPTQTFYGQVLRAAAALAATLVTDATASDQLPPG